MNHYPISVTLITLNEEKKISQAIESVKWASEIIIVDSGSTDQTVAIAQSLGAHVVHHPWPGYGQQKNYAQRLTTQDWVLNLDADEVVSPELAQEIQKMLSTPSEYRGFSFPRKTFFLGRWIRYGGWYPNRLTRLAHRNFSAWSEPHVHEEFQVRGKIGRLTQPLLHYAFDSIEEQVLTNLRFSKLGSQDLKEAGQKPSRTLLILKPSWKFIETFFIKRGFLDGLSGFIISINAAHSMFLKYASLFEMSLRHENSHH